MKKSFLILSVILTGLVLTSCLTDNETEYRGTPLSYISMSESGDIYAKTLDRALDGGLINITSPEIKVLKPGTFVYIAYSWYESKNTITNEGILNATVNQISDPLEQTTLILSDAPELETEYGMSLFAPDFNNNGNPLYLGSNFDYNWFCVYSYEKGNGNKKQLRFYHNLEEGSENEVIIDVRLENVAGTVEKDQTQIPVLVNLKKLNEHYAADMSSSETQKFIKVSFRYFTKLADGTLELNTSQLPYNMVVVK